VSGGSRGKSFHHHQKLSNDHQLSLSYHSPLNQQGLQSNLTKATNYLRNMSQVAKDGFLPNLPPTPDQLHAASQLAVFDQEGQSVMLGSLMRGDKGGKCIVIFVSR